LTEAWKDFITKNVLTEEKNIGLVVKGLPIMAIILEEDDDPRKITSKEIIKVRDKEKIKKNNSERGVEHYIRMEQSNLRKILKVLCELGLLEYVKTPERKKSERPMQLTGLGKNIISRKSEVMEVLETELQTIYKKKNTEKTGLVHLRNHITSLVTKIDEIVQQIGRVRTGPEVNMMDLDIDLFSYLVNNTRFDFQRDKEYPHLKEHLKVFITFEELEDGLARIKDLTEQRVKKNLNELELVKRQLQNVLNLSFSQEIHVPNTFTIHLVKWVMDGLDYHTDALNSKYYQEIWLNFEYGSVHIDDAKEGPMTIVRFTGAPMMVLEGTVDDESIENNYLLTLKKLLKFERDTPILVEYKKMRSLEEEIERTKRDLVMKLIDEKNRDFERDCCKYVNR